MSIASARAGNVIGGGDWAVDRIVPDVYRKWSAGKVAHIRSPNATRPWQHVLEPLSGYLSLGSKLYSKDPACQFQSYNFGPKSEQNKSVGCLVSLLSDKWIHGDAKVKLSENFLM